MNKMQPALAPAPHPSMQNAAQDPADQVLHDQLIAAQQQLSVAQHAAARQQPAPHHMQHAPDTSRDQNNIDPAIAGSAMMNATPQHESPHPEPVSEDGAKGYGKRPLSNTKRAAQNRAAQRAFRQRKETYIRKLEDQVKEYTHLSERFAQLQAENYQLREYIITLQSRLLDSQGEVPELPPNIDLNQSRAELSMAAAGPGAAPSNAPNNTQAISAAAPTMPQQGAPSHSPVGTNNDDMNSLNRIAVAGLGMRKQPNEDPNYLGNGFTAKRMRGDENEQSDGSKSEISHGMPVGS